ncbi:BolA family protein [Maricaulis parjimensis]|uniref:BolA family protein n=1 Tax=Maricaulis parjimensis TaxID=144023 RepID=UPI0019393FC1|nr:BolA family protein [Maricaulis parjimensis]
MTSMQDRIEAKLRDSLSPQALAVTDDSHLHAGHAGARPGGESHFTVEIVSSRFAGLNRVARHRLVNDALAEELTGPIHALVIRAKAPGE